jgi:CBS domain-containing protein
MSSVAGLMVRKRFNHVPVVADTGDIVGILTSPDVLRHVLLRLSDGTDPATKLAGSGAKPPAAKIEAQEEVPAAAA